MYLSKNINNDKRQTDLLCLFTTQLWTFRAPGGIIKYPRVKWGFRKPPNHPFPLIFWVTFMELQRLSINTKTTLYWNITYFTKYPNTKLVIIEYHQYLDPLVPRVTKYCELTSSISIFFLKERCGDSNWALSLYACTRQCWRSYVFSSPTFISTSLSCLQDTCMCFVVKIDFIMR